jgi:hypothetical protein
MVNGLVHGMGRIPSIPDERNWPVSRLVAMIESGVATPVLWDSPVVLDQGTTPHCVGFAGAAYIATEQVNSPENATITNDDGHKLYRECKVIDQNPLGENGSSVHSLMIALKNRGIIDAYAFAAHYEEAKDWVSKYAPVITGLSWYYGMAYPLNGIMRRTGNIIGGHATIIIGTNCAYSGLSLNRVRNSWGRNWGLNGDAYISDEELGLSIHEMGEMAMAVKLTTKPVPPTPPTPPVVPVDPHSLLPWSDFPAMYKEEGWLVKDSGLFEGYDDGTFGPGISIPDYQLVTIFNRLCKRQNVTRLDAARMLAYLLKK